MRQETFQDRITELYEKSFCTSLTEFGNEVGLSRQAIKAYMTGERKLPDGQSIIKICRRFSVSADWLLGLTETQSLSPSVKNAVAALGISENATTRIIDPKHLGHFKETLSHLLENPDFERLLQLYQSFWNNLKHPYTYSEYIAGFLNDEKGYAALAPGLANDFLLNRTVAFFREMLDVELWDNMKMDVDRTADNEENLLKGQ